jgi:hypothetical protein
MQAVGFKRFPVYALVADTPQLRASAENADVTGQRTLVPQTTDVATSAARPARRYPWRLFSLYLPHFVTVEKHLHDDDTGEDGAVEAGRNER